ncbi:MAG: hypothetical protein AVDCRST_MAG67-2803, partial [uncultured Solirubrobacteraceae bacterium]
GADLRRHPRHEAAGPDALRGAGADGAAHAHGVRERDGRVAARAGRRQPPAGGGELSARRPASRRSTRPRSTCCACRRQGRGGHDLWRAAVRAVGLGRRCEGRRCGLQAAADGYGPRHALKDLQAHGAQAALRHVPQPPRPAL